MFCLEHVRSTHQKSMMNVMAYNDIIMDTINIQLIKRVIDKWEFIFVENGNPPLRAYQHTRRVHEGRR
jgi:hypothetical protein